MSENPLVQQCYASVGAKFSDAPPLITFQYIKRKDGIAQESDNPPISPIVEDQGKQYLVFSQRPVIVADNEVQSEYEELFEKFVTTGNVDEDLSTYGIVIVPLPSVIGGKKASSNKKAFPKTRTDKMFTYKKHTYRVYQGSRGGLYIKVKGEWKSISKHSLSKKQ
jgi:hypothetical protein